MKATSPTFLLRVHEWSYEQDWDKTWERSFSSSEELEAAVAGLPEDGISRHVERIRNIPKPRPRGYAHKEF